MSAAKCCARSWGKGSYYSHSCNKTAKVERDGKWYCGIHDPQARDERQAARDAAWNAEFAARQRAQRQCEAEAAEQKRRADCYPDMLNALRRAALALAFAAERSEAMQDDYDAVSAAIAKATGSAT